MTPELAALLAQIERSDDAAAVAGIAARPQLARERCESGGVEGWTALHQAARFGRAAVIDALVAAGADPSARCGDGSNPLHVALEHDNRVRDQLIRAGAEIDAGAAAFLGDLGRLRALLDRRPELANERGTRITPACWAAFGGAAPAIELLVARGARLDDGELAAAAMVGQLDAGRALLAAGADPDELVDGQRPLHAAVRMDYCDDTTAFIRLLLESGADPSLTDEQGRTPLQLAGALAAEQAAHPVEWPRNHAGAAALLREAGDRPARPRLDKKHDRS